MAENGKKSKIWEEKNYARKKCNKNVIKMKKGVAICKQLCYNLDTYIREKE